MKLKPLREYAGGKYPKAARRLLGGIFVAASMTATSLGGCGPGLDSRDLDSALDQGDLDETVECDEAADPGCSDSQDETRR